MPQEQPCATFSQVPCPQREPFHGRERCIGIMQDADSQPAASDAPSLPDDLRACHALILEQARALVAAQESRGQLSQEVEELKAYVARLLHQLYGRRSRTLDLRRAAGDARLRRRSGSGRMLWRKRRRRPRRSSRNIRCVARYKRNMPRRGKRSSPSTSRESRRRSSRRPSSGSARRTAPSSSSVTTPSRRWSSSGRSYGCGCGSMPSTSARASPPAGSRKPSGPRVWWKGVATARAWRPR